jgi:hypothetical protein
MSKAEKDMREEYDFRGGVRGKYVGRLSSTTKVVILDRAKDNKDPKDSKDSDPCCP